MFSQNLFTFEALEKGFDLRYSLEKKLMGFRQLNLENKMGMAKSLI